jgi:hypothetical protein
MRNDEEQDRHIRARTTVRLATRQTRNTETVCRRNVIFQYCNSHTAAINNTSASIINSLQFIAWNSRRIVISDTGPGTVYKAAINRRQFPRERGRFETFSGMDFRSNNVAQSRKWIRSLSIISLAQALFPCLPPYSTVHITYKQGRLS